jgi:ATP-dependent RNA helicase DeaD
MAMYRINVGRRHRVEPRQIVGAIANEGGLRRGDFGSISIRPDFSIVELPADLAPETWAALADTKIMGRPIELQVDRGPRGGGAPRKPRYDDRRDGRPDSREDERRERKPRAKKY